MPLEKAPGPDGFVGLFYKKKCWTIVKKDLIQATMSFYSHRSAKLSLVNEANSVLLPKTQDASTLSDYRPISLINSITKIITKILANRLTPHMNALVACAQNASIKKRCIMITYNNTSWRCTKCGGRIIAGFFLRVCLVGFC